MEIALLTSIGIGICAPTTACVCHALCEYAYMPRPQIKDIRMKSLEDQSQECSICFEQFEKKLCSKLIKCGHVFHKQCMKQWMASDHYNALCPMCRTDVFNIRRPDSVIITTQLEHVQPPVESS